MRLVNKDVCKACINSRRTVANADKGGLVPAPWDAMDEREWARGWVFCPQSDDGENFEGYGIDNGDPLEHCRFKLEHMMAKDKR